MYILTVMESVASFPVFLRFPQHSCTTVHINYMYYLYLSPSCFVCGEAFKFQFILIHCTFIKDFYYTFNREITATSGFPSQTPRTYCAANTEDLETVIEHVYRAHEAAPIMAAGVSMGG